MRWVLRALALGLLAYESGALATPKKGDTISEVVWTRTAEYPVIGFLAGFLAGHLFWNRKG
jgi:hypothetical protein